LKLHPLFLFKVKFSHYEFLEDRILIFGYGLSVSDPGPRGFLYQDIDPGILELFTKLFDRKLDFNHIDVWDIHFQAVRAELFMGHLVFF